MALFVDEAHDPHVKTLIGLKRLMEATADGGMLSVVLVGHPKLRNDLCRPSIQEIDFQTAIFESEGMIGAQLPYIRWLLQTCASEGVAVSDIIDDAAVEMLADRMKIPLQIEQHLTTAFEEAFRVDVRPVTSDVVESILSRQLDDLEPRLTRLGYSVRILPSSAVPNSSRTASVSGPSFDWSWSTTKVVILATCRGSAPAADSTAAKFVNARRTCASKPEARMPLRSLPPWPAT
nr:hypothetical protein [Arenibaculum pallidiluteum]